ncbi:MAG: ribosome maturation factor RimM [Thermodesulfovibrionales bacterium]|nr:ribosome maturation factor RimM [Thermodesulfovibrionales bacterium]
MERYQSNLNNLITVGRVIKSWGLKGEILVEPLTFDVDRFHSLSEVCFCKDNNLQIRKIKHIKRHGKNLVIGVSDCHNLDDAEALKHCYIKIDKSMSPRLPNGVYYYYELEGIEVETIEGEILGIVESIMQAGETDVYVVKDVYGKETLIPAIKDTILSVDVANKKMVVKPLEMI